MQYVEINIYLIYVQYSTLMNSSVQLRVMGWTACVRFPAGIKLFFLVHSIRIALGLSQPTTQWVLESFSLEIKRPEHEADHLHPSSTEVKDIGPPVSLKFSSRCAQERAGKICLRCSAVNCLSSLCVKALK
jgi:hypothetical protein